MNGRETMVLAAVFVVLMAGGTVMMYFMSQAVSDDDPYRQARSYDVSGTVGGSDVTGTGIAEYAAENTNYPAYRFTFTVEGVSNTYEVWMFFDSDDTPVSTIYTHAGQAEVSGETAEVWTWTEDGLSCTAYVTSGCYVLRMELSGDGVSLTADLVRS